MIADIYSKQTIEFRYQLDINISEYFLDNKTIETAKEIIDFYSQCSSEHISSMAISTLFCLPQIKDIPKQYVIDVFKTITKLASKRQCEDFIKSSNIPNFTTEELLNDLEHQLRDEILNKKE